ncbi:phage protease [Profundibacter sp.]
MTVFETAICDLKLPKRDPGKGAPEWVHLFPNGVMKSRDGRVFNLADPQAIVRQFDAGGIDLPVDYEHQNDKQDSLPAGPIPAAGWIKELQARKDGLWGRVEWTDQARALLESKAYRYLSPSFLYLKEGKTIAKLKGAGLVHNPGLHLTALASQEDTMSDITTFMQRVAEMLNLSPDSSEDELLAALQSALTGNDAPDPKKYVPIEALQEAMMERNTGHATMNEERAQAKVNDALQRGYISPAMKEWATALCQQDEASFDGFLEKSVPQFAHLSKPSAARATPPAFARGIKAENGSEQALAVCRQLGIEPGSLGD